MNQQNAKAFAPLVQALGEGKTIQFEYSYGWEDALDEELAESAGPFAVA